MNRIAVISICDFENWNSGHHANIGGTAGVIRSILPFLKAEKIYLVGVTHERKNWRRELQISEQLSCYAISFIPTNSRLPDRIWAFLHSAGINRFLRREGITAVYVHSEEMGFHVAKTFTYLYHMHGSTNALVQSKNKYTRNALFQGLWEALRTSSMKKATKVIAIDHLCLEIASRQVPSGKILLMPNFVDVKMFYPDKSRPNTRFGGSGNVVLFVGRIEEVKGLELFVDTISSLNRCEAGKWEGLLVGSGSCENSLQNYIAKTSDSQLFTFAGPVFDQNELRRIYSNCTVLMISSLYEGIPMVLLECLACNTPVISTDVGGVRNILESTSDSIVVSGRDPEAFCRQILRLSQTPKVCQSKEFGFSAEKSSEVINEILLS